METTPVGFRFDPKDDELIIYFLKNKILGKLWLVDNTIREVNMCSYDPAALPALWLVKSKDKVWYFTSPKEYTSAKKVSRKRTTPSGFWKPTGQDRKVKVESAVIGTKRTLTYHQGNSSNAVWTPWTIHEYEITILPILDQDYVLCMLFYKGNAQDIPSGSNSTEPSHSLATVVSNPAGAAAPQTTKVGYRFSPTDVELIMYYLKNKMVNDTIREVKMCSYDPADLPALSLVKSKDEVWYFTSPKEYTSAKKVSRKRTTPSGFWKPTGKDRKVKVESAVIGTKRTLTYHQGNSSNAVRTPWTIHEYEITILTHVDQDYVLCKLFKGNAQDIASGSNSTEPSHSLAPVVSNPAGAVAPQVVQAGEESLPYFSVNDVTMIMNNPNGQLPDDGEFLGALAHVNSEDVEFLFTDDQEPITQESCDEYMHKWLC